MKHSIKLPNASINGDSPPPDNSNEPGLSSFHKRSYEAVAGVPVPVVVSEIAVEIVKEVCMYARLGEPRKFADLVEPKGFIDGVKIWFGAERTRGLPKISRLGLANHYDAQPCSENTPLLTKIFGHAALTAYHQVCDSLIIQPMEEKLLATAEKIFAKCEYTVNEFSDFSKLTDARSNLMKHKITMPVPERVMELATAANKLQFLKQFHDPELQCLAEEIDRRLSDRTAHFTYGQLSDNRFNLTKLCEKSGFQSPSYSSPKNGSTSDAINNSGAGILCSMLIDLLRAPH